MTDLTKLTNEAWALCCKISKILREREGEKDVIIWNSRVGKLCAAHSNAYERYKRRSNKEFWLNEKRRSEMKLDYTENRRTIHTIACGLGETVEVFGDPENASYEWLIRSNGKIEQHSNDGYGDDSIALMHGLIKYHDYETNIKKPGSL